MILPTTLCLTAAAIILNFWLGMRIGRLRGQLKINVGDAGDERMIRAMRAQSNFLEQTVLTVILFGLIEMTGRGSWWLSPLAIIFIAGRIAHAFGMDGGFKAGRPIGMITSFLTQAVLIVAGAMVLFTAMQHPNIYAMPLR